MALYCSNRTVNKTPSIFSSGHRSCWTGPIPFYICLINSPVTLFPTKSHSEALLSIKRGHKFITGSRIERIIDAMRQRWPLPWPLGNQRNGDGEASSEDGHLWSQEEEPEHKAGNKDGSIKGSSKAGKSVPSGKEFGVQCCRENKGKKHEGW